MADLAIRITAQDQAGGVLKGLAAALHGLGTAATSPIRALGALTNTLGKIGLAAMGIKAVGTAIAGLASPFTDAVKAASDMNESVSKAEVVFGAYSKTIFDFAATSAQSMGLSSQKTTEMAGTFGNLFTAMGLTQKAAAGMSKDVLMLGADLASFNNIPVEEALLKIKSGLVGESEPLRSLGINLTEAGVAAEVLALRLDTSTEAAAASAKVQARYSLILKQSKNAQGDFSRTSTGMANSLRIIDASFKDLQTAIGQELLPVIAPLISAFAQALPKAFEAVRPLIKGFGDSARDAIQWVIGLGRGVRDLIGYLGSGNKRDLMREWFGDAGPAIDGVVRTIKGGIDRALGDVRGLWDAVFGKTISGTTEYGEQWTRHVDGIWDTIKGAFAKGGLAGVGVLIGNALAAEWAKIDWGATWTAFEVTVATVGQWLAGAGTAIIAWLTSLWPTAAQWAGIWKVLTVTSLTIGEWFGNAGNAVVAWLQSIWPTTEGWSDIWKVLSVTSATVGAWFAGAGDAVADWLRSVWPSNEKWAEIWKGTKIALTELTIAVGNLRINAAATDVTVPPAPPIPTADLRKQWELDLDKMSDTARQRAARFGTDMEGGAGPGLDGFGQKVLARLSSGINWDTLRGIGEAIGRIIAAPFLVLLGPTVTLYAASIQGLLVDPISNALRVLSARTIVWGKEWETWLTYVGGLMQERWVGRVVTAVEDIKGAWNSIGPAIGDAWTLAMQWLSVWGVGMQIWAREQIAPIQSVIDKFNQYKNAIAGAIGLTPAKSPYLYEPTVDIDPITGRPRAAGGPVWPGASFLVGEQGPEIFRPSSAGTIVPNNRISNSYGGNTITFYITTPTPAQAGDAVVGRLHSLGLA